jgi:hypothetical protein
MPLCPFKPDLVCEATPKLAEQSRCIDCPYVPQYVLVDILLRIKQAQKVIA